MLGRFLEFSVETPDIGASLEFYAKLGFSQADVGDAWHHPYAVVTDGRICIGLHQHSLGAPQLTFVKPDLLKHFDALERLGLEFEFRRLGNNVFNEVGWRDPSGHLIRLVEARTFSPSKRPTTDHAACGYFLEIVLPSQNIEDSKSFWERLGFVGMDEPGTRLPHVCCTSDTINIGLYDPSELPDAALLFDADDIPGRVARLAQLGVQAARRPPASLQRGPAALFVAPEGTPILMWSGGHG